MHRNWSQTKLAQCVALAAAPVLISSASQAAAAEWSTFAGDSQHTGISAAAAQPLDVIKWTTSVDLDPQYYSGFLNIHYGSPVITPASTVIVPVKTAASNGYELRAFDGTSGALKWSAASDYAVPTGTFFVPSYNACIATSDTVYYP